MTRREAKREACFLVSLWIDTILGEGYGDDKDPKVVDGIQELRDELVRRGTMTVDPPRGRPS